MRPANGSRSFDWLVLDRIPMTEIVLSVPFRWCGTCLDRRSARPGNPQVRRPGVAHRFSCLLVRPIPRCAFHGQGRRAENLSAGTRQAVFSRDFGEQRFLCFVERLDCEFAGDGRELPKEFPEGIAAFEVVNQVPERNTSTAKTWSARHDVGVPYDCWFGQVLMLTPGLAVGVVESCMGG